MIKTINPKTDGNEHMATEDDNEDVMAIRHVEVAGQSYKVIADGQYALWSIQTSVGPLPQVLKGQYTSPDEATKAIEAYQKAKK